MTPGYAVIPNQEDGPIAVFCNLEDAVDWGTLRFGAGAFHVDPVRTEVAIPIRSRQNVAS